MSTITFDELATDELPELLRGIGVASPGPLFLVDSDGGTRPLNGHAHALESRDALAVGFVSPVVQGVDRVGQVVGYVRPEGDDGDESLMAALVALAARVASRSLEGAVVERDEVPDLAREDAGRTVLESASAELGAATDPVRAASILVEGVRSALGARNAILWLRGDAPRRMDPVAASGVELEAVRGITPGRRLLGWAMERTEPTWIGSSLRVPADAPRDKGSACVGEPWMDLPLLVLPLRSGPHLLAVLAVSGIPAAPGRLGCGRHATKLVEPLVDRATAVLAGACLVQQARREERVARELEIAQQIQASLLPRQAPTFAGLQVAGECRPAAQVGGDFIGFKELEHGVLTATVFDTAGHGIGAAFCMTLVRSALHGEYARGGTLAGVLDRANELLWEDLSGSGLFATALALRFERRRGLVRYANAGHARPIVWRASERRFRDRYEGGLPLGLLSSSTYGEGDLEFGEGDLLVAYTDGIVEATNAEGEKFGRGRLLAAVRRYRRRPARVILRALWREIERFTGGVSLVDDATLLVVRGEAGFGVRETRADGSRGRASAEREALGWEEVLAE